MSDDTPSHDSLSDTELKAKLNMETGQISWLELQRFFAMGKLLCVDSSIDLVEAAFHFTRNHTGQVAEWVDSKKLSPVNDQQAQQWHKDNADLWSIVVSPWVLVQLHDS